MTIYNEDFFVGRRQTVSLSASIVVPVVCKLLEPQSVIDIGCGQGEWLEVFAEHVPVTYGVDIAAPEDHERFLRHNLLYPLSTGIFYDLVVCLEVAEHLPADAADTLVDSLVRHGTDVLFSAAVPGQAGKGHINCQPHEYWHNKFSGRGYEVCDAVRPHIRRDVRVSPWYRENIFLYRES